MDVFEDRLLLAGRIAQGMAMLHDESDDNPEYYRGMEELGAYLIGGDPEVARNLINNMVDLVRAGDL